MQAELRGNKSKVGCQLGFTGGLEPKDGVKRRLPRMSVLCGQVRLANAAHATKCKEAWAPISTLCAIDIGAEQMSINLLQNGTAANKVGVAWPGDCKTGQLDRLRCCQ